MTHNTFVRRGEKLPRNKYGSKPGYFPERNLTDPDAKPSVETRLGKSRRVSGGYVMQTYSVPLTAPVHQSRKDGRVYNAVFHKWGSGPDITPDAPLAEVIGKHGRDARRKGKVGKVVKGKVVSPPRQTVFDKTLRVQGEQGKSYGVRTGLWRKWVTDSEAPE